MARVTRRLLDRLRADLKKKGIDPQRFNPDKLRIVERGKQLRFKYGDVTVSIPGPSPKIIDGWWKRHGGVLAGAFVAILGVAAGAAATALGKRA